MQDVYLTIRFKDLFTKDMTEELRKERWAEWLALAKNAPMGEWCLSYWGDVSACHENGGCQHLEEHWCKSRGLPANVNPVTWRLGMACCGLGRLPLAYISH